MSRRLGTLILLLALLLPCASGLFTDGFQAYLTQQFGSAAAKQLIRSDLGVNGSFGGNHFKTAIRIYRDPVVFVHGLNTTAGAVLTHRDFFYHSTYGIGEMYATSYGPTGKPVDATSALECSYIKQLRQLITAVVGYTGKRVAIVAHSVGVALARKAVLGGQCVDTKENLGNPLTSKVSAFLSVAGANLGAVECSSFPNSKVCNAVNGLKSGSAFLKDINSKSGYEGSARYAIGSQADDIVGYANESLPGATINVTLSCYNHGDTLSNTLNIQLSLIWKGYVSQFNIDKDCYAESQLASQNCTGSASGGETSYVAPHISKTSLQGGSEGDDQFHGEYNKAAKIYMFLNGFNYTRHLDPRRGNFFKPKP